MRLVTATSALAGHERRRYADVTCRQSAEVEGSLDRFGESSFQLGQQPADLATEVSDGDRHDVVQVDDAGEIQAVRNA